MVFGKLGISAIDSECEPIEYMFKHSYKIEISSDQVHLFPSGKMFLLCILFYMLDQMGILGL